MKWVIRKEINFILENSIYSQWPKMLQLKLCKEGDSKGFSASSYLSFERVCFFFFCIVPICYHISALAQIDMGWNCIEEFPSLLSGNKSD